VNPSKEKPMKWLLSAGAVSCLIIGLWIVRNRKEGGETPAAQPGQHLLSAADQPTQIQEATSVAAPAAHRHPSPEPELLKSPREFRVWPVSLVEMRPAESSSTLFPKLPNAASADDFALMLSAIPELRFATDAEGRHYLNDRARGKELHQVSKPPERISSHPLAVGLPWRLGQVCVTDGDAAERLAFRSRKIRAMFTQIERGPKRQAENQGRTRDTVAVLMSQSSVWRHAEAAPLLWQMLQAEDVFYRLILVDMLHQTTGRRATEVLARIAVFDVDERIRTAAVNRLRPRPFAEARETLLTSFRHVWPPAAEHAADALIALDARSTLPELVAALNLPDPRRPFPADDPKTYSIREMIRLNHNFNCAVCHSAAGSELAATSLVVSTPTPGRPLITFPSPDYYILPEPESDALVVRFDVTYLRQDFSVSLDCKVDEKWPSRQRYDFLTRVRPATPAEVASLADDDGSFPQKEAVLKVLRKLTGKDGADDPAVWGRIVSEVPND
jgi:hypothetical protein